MGGGVTPLTSIVTDGRLPVPPTRHLAAAVGGAPESIAVVAVEGDLVTHVVVGGPGPVLPVLKGLWSWAMNRFEGERQAEFTEREGLPFRVSLLVSRSLSQSKSTFLVPQEQGPQPLGNPAAPPFPFLSVLLAARC